MLVLRASRLGRAIELVRTKTSAASLAGSVQAPNWRSGMTLQRTLQEMDVLADPVRAAHSDRYFDTGPGGVGEGDVFLGIPVPAQRRVARGARELDLDDVERLLASSVHEHRFVALVILVERFRRAGAETRARLSSFYVEHLAAVNHWDLVDASAPYLLGEQLVDQPCDILDRLASSRRVWDRRIAIMATRAHIRAGDLDVTMRLSERLLDDPHHLVHKATGWMLREAAKRDEALILKWLESHAHRMPRVTLSYATERLPAAERTRLRGLSRPR